MDNFWYVHVLLVGGLCLAFSAFVVGKSNWSEERYARCSDPCLTGCTNHTHTGGRLEVLCQSLKCKCIPDGIPRDVTSLVFTGNNIKVLRAGTFQNLTDLEELDLRSNNIHTFEYGTFKTLVKLRRLDLSYNFFSWNTMEFCLLVKNNLTELRLSRVVTRPQPKKDWFIANMHLKILFYAGNRLEYIPFIAGSRHGSGTTNLTELHLEDNMIREIDASDLAGLKHLEHLFLCRNFIDFIRNDTFEYSRKLKYLNLKGNPLLRLEHNSLMSNTIEFMNLAKTQLFSGQQYSSKHPLNINNSISSLDLSGTNLNTHLLNGFVKYYKALKNLNVNQNNIDMLTNETLHNLESLQELRAANNSLTQISESSLPPKLWRQLKIFDLSGNPFRCDCKLFKFSQWIKENNFSNSRKLLDNMQCEDDGRQSFPFREAEDRLKMECLVEEKEWLLFALIATVFVISFLSTFASTVHRFRWNIRYWIFTHKIKTRRFKQVRDKKHYTYDAFISYSETDSKWVIHQLLPRLESEYHLRLCIHQRDWLAGRDIAENIVLSIEQSRKTVLIVSNAFAVSQWCHFEMTMAQSRVFQDDRDNLVLVMLEEIPACNMSPRLRMLTERQTYVQWDDHALGQQLFWVKLLQALTKPAQRVTDSVPPLDVFVA